MGLDRAEDAIAHLERAIEQAPAWSIAHRFHGDALAALGRTHEAHAAYAQAVDFNPWDAKASMGRDLTAARTLVGDE